MHLRLDEKQTKFHGDINVIMIKQNEKIIIRNTLAIFMKDKIF